LANGPQKIQCCSIIFSVFVKDNLEAYNRPSEADNGVKNLLQTGRGIIHRGKVARSTIPCDRMTKLPFHFWRQGEDPYPKVLLVEYLLSKENNEAILLQAR